MTIPRTFLFPLSLLTLGACLVRGGDLHDPAEAARYRRKPAVLTEGILESAATQPTSQPDLRAGAPADSQPDTPFVLEARPDPDRLPGYIELSDGTILPGLIYTTREKPWSVFEAATRTFRRIPPAIVRRIDAQVVWERDEPDWRWKEAGSDEKVYTGRTYPARMLNYAFALVNGERIAGTVQQPIYVKLDDSIVRAGEPAGSLGAAGSAGSLGTAGPAGSQQEERVEQYILHERDKGPLDGKLADLVYVRHVFLGQEALARGRQLLVGLQPSSRPDAR